MNLYLLTQNENTGYDTYDSCVVAAKTPEDAVRIHPHVYSEEELYWVSELDGIDTTTYTPWENNNSEGWCSSPDQVKCTLIGHAMAGTECGVILASFNAG